MKLTDKVQNILNKAASNANNLRHEFIMPEHVLMALMSDKEFAGVMLLSLADYKEMGKRLINFLNLTEKVPENVEYDIMPSKQFDKMMQIAISQANSSGRDMIDVPHVVVAMTELKDSMACNLLTDGIGVSMAEMINNLVNVYDNEDEDDFFDGDSLMGEPVEMERMAWESLVTCINDTLDSHNPLIGRESELERTIQVLCRKDKNNPLHIGEPGVGKTALIYGLARRIEEGMVPDRLIGSRIYLLDIGSLIAGTQFRGDFEKRIKTIMDGLSKEEGAIVYIDEIHNLIGAGSTGEGSLDASNMLKPYLEDGTIRFIGSTTYQEYNRYMSKHHSIVRRFQQIDIPEPSLSETVDILRGLKASYEEYHKVAIPDEMLVYAAEMSQRHITGRYLPDKAIDIIDEAAAWLETHPLLNKNGKPKQRRFQKVDRGLINKILARVCKLDEQQLNPTDNDNLSTLKSRILAQIYGQDEAVSRVVEAMEVSKAGLNDEDKPISSLLFVGPTGVGKTELARTLAREMGMELVRFDMSEYTEKHAVAKLIGSPAGYVGYEDGGQLTDAVRKSPNCVLLLDEIEKAHPDIYNILLQVMDYARLTDNRGQKADFHNVVLIMTSNAGAQYASQASVGFTGGQTKGQAMRQQLKRVFKPEFLGRLNGIAVFNDMDSHMAEQVLDKKLASLNEKLVARNVTLTLTDAARALLLHEGFTRENGAREMEHTVQRLLWPLLTHELLYGSLKKGGKAVVTAADGQLVMDKTRR